MVFFCIGLGIYLTSAVPSYCNGNLAGGQNCNAIINQTTMISGGNSSGGNLTFNQTLTDTLYANIIWGYNQSDGVGTGNASWNQSLADTLYAGIEWDYNQTYSGSIFNSSYQAGGINTSILFNKNGDNAGTENFTYNITGIVSLKSTTNRLYNYFIRGKDGQILAGWGDAGDGVTSSMSFFGNGTANQYFSALDLRDTSIAVYPNENRVAGMLGRKMGTNSYKIAFLQRVGASLKSAMSFDTNGYVAISGTDWETANARLEVKNATGDQLRLSVDASNYIRFSVGTNGMTTLTPTGAGKGLILASNLTINENLYMPNGNITAKTYANASGSVGMTQTYTFMCTAVTSQTLTYTGGILTSNTSCA